MDGDLFPMRRSVNLEPSVQGEAHLTAGPTLLKESRRLIEQSHQLLQAANLLLEQCEPHNPIMRVPVKRLGVLGNGRLSTTPARRASTSSTAVIARVT